MKNKIKGGITAFEVEQNDAWHCEYIEQSIGEEIVITATLKLKKSSKTATKLINKADKAVSSPLMYVLRETYNEKKRLLTENFNMDKNKRAEYIEAQIEKLNKIRGITT